MSDLISRISAIDAINSHFGFNIEEEYGSAVQEVINSLPSAEPERKKGKWELIDEAEPRRYACSECKCLSWYGIYNYCPNCGADMREE